MQNAYYTKLTFKGKSMEIGILPVEDNGYDLEIISRERISGDEFQSLRKYLEDEGYLEAAKKFLYD